MIGEDATVYVKQEKQKPAKAVKLIWNPRKDLVLARMVMPYAANHAQRVNVNNADAANPVMN